MECPPPEAPEIRLRIAGTAVRSANRRFKADSAYGASSRTCFEHVLSCPTSLSQGREPVLLSMLSPDHPTAGRFSVWNLWICRGIRAGYRNISGPAEHVQASYRIPLDGPGNLLPILA